MIAAATAVHALALLGGLAVALAALELLAARHAWRADGVFAWATMRGRLATSPAPVRALLDATLDDRGFTALLAGLVGGGLALAWVPHPALACAVAVLQLGVSVRFGGSFNGGSDAMLLVVVIGVALARAVSAPLGLGYVAAQLVLSYGIAGIVKLRVRGWRDGTALAQLLTAPPYRVAPCVLRLIGRRHVALAASWLVITLECGFPAALVAPELAIALLVGAGAFHVGNALVLGLNRFVWAWLAAYPALLYWVR